MRGFCLLFRGRAGALAALLLLCIAAGGADAQTKRRKRAVPRSPATVQSPASSEPQVISRAEDFPDSSNQIVTTAPLPTPTPSGTDDPSRSLEDLENRIKSLEAGRKNDKDEKQKRLLLNLDILTRAEERAATLRKQLFDMIDKENSIKTRLDNIENEMRPDAIDRSLALSGSLRPEELRTARRKSLEAEKANLDSLLAEIQRTKANLDQSVQKADAMVDKLRTKLEKDIDAAIDDGTENNP